MNEICLEIMTSQFREVANVVWLTVNSNFSQDEPSYNGSSSNVIAFGPLFSPARGRRSLELLLLGAGANNQTDGPLVEPTVQIVKGSKPDTADELGSDSIVVDEFFKNVTDELLRYLDQNLERFRYSTEAYVMTPIAVFGILFNILSLVALSLDHRTAKSYRSFHFAYLLSQVMFLVVAVFFIQVKGYRANMKNGDFRGYIKSLESINYLSICFGVVHFAQPWVLTILADHGRKSLESLFEIGPKPTIPRSLLWATAVFAVLQFVTYLPPVRIGLHDALKESYSLCNSPIEKQWNIDRPIQRDIQFSGGLSSIDQLEVQESDDVIFLTVYCLSYALAIYIIPFFVLGYLSKRIVDLIKSLQEQPKVFPHHHGIACSSLVISASCNVYLVSVTLKIIVWTFYVVEVLTDDISTAYVFFQYVNVFANLFIIVGAGCHLFLLVLFNVTVKYFLSRSVFAMRLKLGRLADALPFGKRSETKVKEPVKV